MKYLIKLTGEKTIKVLEQKHILLVPDSLTMTELFDWLQAVKHPLRTGELAVIRREQ